MWLISQGYYEVQEETYKVERCYGFAFCLDTSVQFHRLAVALLIKILFYYTNAVSLYVICNWYVLITVTMVIKIELHYVKDENLYES